MSFGSFGSFMSFGSFGFFGGHKPPTLNQSAQPWDKGLATAGTEKKP
jgi:hypothetical protein